MLGRRKRGSSKREEENSILQSQESRCFCRRRITRLLRKCVKFQFFRRDGHRGGATDSGGVGRRRGVGGHRASTCGSRGQWVSSLVPHASGFAPISVSIFPSLSIDPHSRVFSSDCLWFCRREERPTRSVTPREDESKSVLQDGAVASETCGEASPGEAAGYTVLSKHELDAEEMNPPSGDVGGETVLEMGNNVPDEHPKKPRRLLPVWGQKKATENIAQVQAPQLRVKIEADWSEAKLVVVQTNLSQLTDSWAMARPACKGNGADE